MVWKTFKGRGRKGGRVLRTEEPEQEIGMRPKEQEHKKGPAPSDPGSICSRFTLANKGEREGI